MVELPDAFDTSLGLIKPIAASSQEAGFVHTWLLQENSIGPLPVVTSVMARLQSGLTVSKTDVVLIQANDQTNVVAAQLWLLACVDGIEVALASV